MKNSSSQHGPTSSSFLMRSTVRNIQMAFLSSRSIHGQVKNPYPTQIITDLHENFVHGPLMNNIGFLMDGVKILSDRPHNHSSDTFRSFSEREFQVLIKPEKNLNLFVRISTKISKAVAQNSGRALFRVAPLFLLSFLN